MKKLLIVVLASVGGVLLFSLVATVGLAIATTLLNGKTDSKEA
jgi:hypothetical protein